jgi:hypothetical protein
MIRICNGYCESFAYLEPLMPIWMERGHVRCLIAGGDYVRIARCYRAVSLHFISAVKDSVANRDWHRGSSTGPL